MRAVISIILLSVFAATPPEFSHPEAKPLLNGTDFAGWVRFLPDASAEVDAAWQVKEGGVYWCSGSPAGYLRTEDSYSNYKLRLEWRWPEGGGNNGVLVHVQDKDEVWPKSIEVQLQHGNAGDFWVIGGADFKEHTNPAHRRVARRHASTEKALGEWNVMEVFCRGDSIEVYVNGVLQNVATECTLSEGRIALQSEGTPIEYRNVTLVRL